VININRRRNGKANVKFLMLFIVLLLAIAALVVALVVFPRLGDTPKPPEAPVEEKPVEAPKDEATTSEPENRTDTSTPRTVCFEAEDLPASGRYLSRAVTLWETGHRGELPCVFIGQISGSADAAGSEPSDTDDSSPNMDAVMELLTAAESLRLAYDETATLKECGIYQAGGRYVILVCASDYSFVVSEFMAAAEQETVMDIDDVADALKEIVVEDA